MSEIIPSIIPTEESIPPQPQPQITDPLVDPPVVVKKASEIIEVEPKSGPVISFVKINIYQLTLGVGFKCVCYLMDLDYNIIEARDLAIEGEDYNTWSDDTDMLNLILSKLGLVQKV